MQSFVSCELARTGRKHNAATSSSEVAMLRAAGIGNFNIDLIAGLPGQTSGRAGANRSTGSSASRPRTSPSTCSKWTRTAAWDARFFTAVARYGAGDAPSEDATVELYETAVERLAGMGLGRYEISNFARPGFESRHNLKYWRLEPYAGFGADAHSFDGVTRSQNAESPQEYVARYERGESPRAEATPAKLDEERFFVGLRLSEGIRPRPEEWRRCDAPIRRFLEAGLLETDGDTLRLTARGVLLSNEVFQEFIECMNPVEFIDLRSDTVTRPTAAMRRAMAEAEVGDDVYGEDPTVNRLEQRAAEIFGKEAGLFVPTGTMGNTIGVKLHTQHGQEVICEARSHVFNYELSMLAWFSGCVARPIHAEDGILTWDADPRRSGRSARTARRPASSKSRTRTTWPAAR